MKGSIKLAWIVVAYCILGGVHSYGFDSEWDKPCAARHIPGKSVICVCNATYCDTVTREKPACGSFVAYTSSEAGLRFQKSYGPMEKFRTAAIPDVPILEINPEVLYQEISGFGGAVTDSVGINWNSLEDPILRQYFVDSYFSNKGIEYNMMRIPIGGTDFSTHAYAYNQTPLDDKLLLNFALAAEDHDLKIPLIKACQAVAETPIRAVASLWSPPAWMKTSNNITSGFLKTEYYQTLADYFYKFIDSYNEYGIRIWGITTTNEPLNSIYVSSIINRLQWNVADMGEWISNNLGPTLRNSTYKDVKIIACDDQRNFIPLLFNFLVATTSTALEYIDGIGVHFYYDELVPATQMTAAVQDYPEKFLLYTEASEGVTASDDEKVDLGNWTRAESYAYNILEDLNHKVIGWLDWNMCLNASGGPTWIDNRIDAPVIVSADRREFYKQPMFYAIGHFSKFIPRGSRRVQSELLFAGVLEHTAFLTPENTIVVVLLNRGTRKEVVVSLGEESALVPVEASSFTTLEFPYKSIAKNHC